MRSMEEKKKLVVLTGPTAAGKTKLSIALAKAIGGEIISADSVQVYRRMDIGSAKIRPEEMCGVPHHLIDLLEPDEDFHVLKFQELCKEAMEEIYHKNHIPFLVGGTGFYIQAVLRDVEFSREENDPAYREELRLLAEREGNDALHALLEAADPEAALAIPAGNRKRVIRALEYHRLTGGRISEHNREQAARTSPYDYAYFVLSDRRDRLYERIDRRVDEMMEAGLLAEVKALKAEGIPREATSMQALGYKEIYDYLEGLCTLEEAVYQIKLRTRHFAKRQLTWFRREPDTVFFQKDEYDYDEEAILKAMLTQLQNRGIIQEKT